MKLIESSRGFTTLFKEKILQPLTMAYAVT